MITGVQIVGLIFGLFMCFLSFLHFKKKEFGPKSLFVWMFIWVSFIFSVMYPKFVYSFMDVLSLTRTIDFFVIFGFFLFTVIIFYMYILVKKTEQKVERLVRKLAIDTIEHKKSSKIK